MENQNKPDWLIKAQEEMAKFADTKIGKMSNKEFIRHEANKENAKCVDREKLGKILSESYKNNPEMKIKLKQNAINSHLKAKQNGSYQTIEFKEKMRNNGLKHVKSGHLENIRDIATQASIKSRINSAKERKLNILQHIPMDFEFEVTKHLKPICIKYNEVHGYWSKIVKDKTLVEKVYNGTSRFDPPRYKKINETK